MLFGDSFFLDPYADPYGDSTGWTRQFGTDCDLRVFRVKEPKSLELQQKIRISAAHNPEVVGSSPASATKKVLKSKDFRTFSFVSTLKSWMLFSRKTADPYPDPYHDSIQWTRQHQRLFPGHQVPEIRETIRNPPVKFSSLKLCKSNNFALGTVR